MEQTANTNENYALALDTVRVHVAAYQGIANEMLFNNYFMIIGFIFPGDFHLMNIT